MQINGLTRKKARFGQSREKRVMSGKNGRSRESLPTEIVQTPYREFAQPVLEQIDAIKRDYPDRLIAIIVPEVIENDWREDFRVIVIGLPWFVEIPRLIPCPSRGVTGSGDRIDR
jgi:hypothetical protein